METSGERAIGQAPGRLDVLGGVADYSGSLVLELPIEASVRVALRPLPESRLVLHSEGAGRAALDTEPLWSALRSNPSDEELRKLLDDLGAPRWTRYPVGCLLLYCREKGWLPHGGLAVDISSTVPQSMGVASSAALEIATLRALVRLTGIPDRDNELAHLGQRAENRIVGAPCGLMDQLTSAYGRPGHLLPIECRPDRLLPTLALPDGVRIVGWPSGIKHAVGGSAYGRARAAAFMGKKMLETHLGRQWQFAAEIAPSLFWRHAEQFLPDAITGADYHSRYPAVDDPLSRIDPGEPYPVFDGLRFPVEENFRAGLAVSLLRHVYEADRYEVLTRVGELMLQSHAGYSAIGLGCEETDHMVDAVMDIGPEGGIYGARTSGGGSGGTVVILAEDRALPQLQALARQMFFTPGGPLELIR